MISQVYNSVKTSGQEEPVQHQRLYYLDWLRVLAVLGVFYAHTAEIFDTFYWHMRQAGHSVVWDALGTFGARWGITLFFILAGASAWFALRTRTSRQFIGERFKRLLIPFIVAFILIAPIQAYFMALIRSSYNGNLVQFFPYFFVNIHVGWDLTWLATYSYHLWFLAYLFTISILVLPLLLYLKRKRGARFISWLAALCSRPAGLFVFVLPIALVQIILLAPFPGYPGWADFFSWVFIFVYGFIFLSDTRFEAALRKQGKYFLCILIICILTLLITNSAGVFGNWKQSPGYSEGYLFSRFLSSIITWSVIVSALYIWMRFLNFDNKVLRYANEAILPLFILHPSVILVISFYVLPLNLDSGVKYLVVSTAALIATLVLYELLIRRITVLRWLFGLKTSKPAQL
jgi:glucan biosynthesis protein C